MGVVLFNKGLVQGVSCSMIMHAFCAYAALSAVEKAGVPCCFWPLNTELPLERVKLLSWQQILSELASMHVI